MYSTMFYFFNSVSYYQIDIVLVTLDHHQTTATYLEPHASCDQVFSSQDCFSKINVKIMILLHRPNNVCRLRLGYILFLQLTAHRAVIRGLALHQACVRAVQAGLEIPAIQVIWPFHTCFICNLTILHDTSCKYKWCINDACLFVYLFPNLFSYFQSLGAVSIVNPSLPLIR